MRILLCVKWRTTTLYQTKLKWFYQELKLIFQLSLNKILLLLNNLVLWTKLKLLIMYALLLLDKPQTFSTLEMFWLVKMLRLFPKFKLMKLWTILMLFLKNQTVLWFLDKIYHLKFHQKKCLLLKNGWLKNVILRLNLLW